MQKALTCVLFLALCYLFTTEARLHSHELVRNGSDIYLIPRDAPHTETLIYLHGVGGSAAGMYTMLFANESTMLARNSTKIVLLTAPTAYVNWTRTTMHSWFNIITNKIDTEIDMKNAFDFHELVSMGLKIQDIMTEEVKLLGGDSTKLFIGGFSQGCIMSLYVSLIFNQTLGGVMGSSGCLVMIPRLENGPNTNIPMFLTHGKADNVVDYGLASQLYEDRLSPLSHPITKVFEDGVGHSISSSMKAKGREWFFKMTQPKTEQLSFETQ